jgi:hypothetical protein
MTLKSFLRLHFKQPELNTAKPSANSITATTTGYLFKGELKLERTLFK